MRFRFIISSTVFFLALHSFVVAQNFGCYDTPTNNNRYVDYIRTSDDFRNEPSFDGFSIDTHKNGFCEEYYKTRPWYPKQPKMYGVVLNGKKQGKWVLYIKDSLKCIGNYANGLKEGIWRYGFFKSNGDTEIFWSGTFMHDTLNGIVKKYNISSKGKVSIEEKINYLNGLKNGMDIKFFSDGRVEKLMNYINGKKNGNEIEYSENSIKPSENYVDSNNYRVIAVHYYFND
ncbi:MAG TPA: hypothetical protein VNG53_08740, partial [Bacteroidia bacterium]|nr:hypothetical protein [Bacteroidia bacterium]